MNRENDEMKQWAFNLGQTVFLVESGECGVVIGRAEYAEGIPDSFYVRFKGGDGRQRKEWWNAADMKEGAS